MLIRAFRLCLAVVAALTLAPAEAVAQTPQQRREWRETRAMCPALRNVDFARLNAESESDDWRTDARQMLRATDQPQLGDADIVLRFYAPPGFGGSMTTWTTARRVHGEWLVRREDRPLTTAGPPPHDPFTLDFRASRPRSPIVINEGPLTPESARVLETALADPCFLREPDSVGAALPTRDGRGEICYDGAPFFLQVERAEGVLTRVHVCQPRWRTGEIIRTLETAAMIEARSTRTETLSELILIDENGHNIAAAEAPPPARISISGDAGGREVIFTLFGSQYPAVALAPEGLSWRIWPSFGAAPPDWAIALAGCPGAGLGGPLPEPGHTAHVVARGCQLDFGEE